MGCMCMRHLQGKSANAKQSANLLLEVQSLSSDDFALQQEYSSRWPDSTIAVQHAQNGYAQCDTKHFHAAQHHMIHHVTPCHMIHAMQQHTT